MLVLRKKSFAIVCLHCHYIYKEYITSKKKKIPKTLYDLLSSSKRRKKEKVSLFPQWSRILSPSPCSETQKVVRKAHGIFLLWCTTLSCLAKCIILHQKSLFLVHYGAWFQFLFWPQQGLAFAFERPKSPLKTSETWFALLSATVKHFKRIRPDKVSGYFWVPGFLLYLSLQLFSVLTYQCTWRPCPSLNEDSPYLLEESHTWSFSRVLPSLLFAWTKKLQVTPFYNRNLIWLALVLSTGI